MAVSRNRLCAAYALIALAALIGTWGNNIAYMSLGFLGANLTFWQETLGSPASRSITIDLLFLGLAVFVWMLLEARRVGMRWVWLYLVFGLIIAISVTIPLFLIHRETAIAARDPLRPAGTLTAADVVGLAVVVLACLAYTVLALPGLR